MMPKMKRRPKTPTPKVLSSQQQNLLYDALRQAGNLRDRTLILLVLKTGLKSAEVCKLNVADVFKDGQVIATLTVRPEMTTNGIPRRLPLSSDVQNAIEDFIRWKKQAGESLQSSAPLFCAVRTKKRLASRDFQRLLKNACTALGHQFTPNDLRHTFATELYQKTGDLESVRVALGLRSLKPEQVAMYTRSSESGELKISLPHGEKNSDVETNSPKRGVCRTYDVTDGLPAGVGSILQDRHGYLWLGTSAGLCRYDGTEFITYTTADGLAGNLIHSICEDHRGRLWIGTARDGVSCYDGTQFINFTTAHGLADNQVSGICEDRNGYLWIGTRGSGVSRFDGEAFATYTTEDGLAGNDVRAICEDQQGRLWFATLDGGVSCVVHPEPFTSFEDKLRRRDGVQFTNYTKADGLPDDCVWDVCSDQQGRLWFAIRGFHPERGYGVTCFDGNHFTTYTTEHGLSSDYIHRISADREGRLWFCFIGNGRGVSCFDGERFTTYTIEDGLLSNWVNRVIQDREGQFWVSHWNAGLTCFDNETMQLLTEEPVQALIQGRRGRLWFKNDKNELCCLDEGRQRCQSFNVETRGRLEDSRGRFWVATFGDGLFCYDSADAVWEDGEGTPVARAHYTVEDGLGSNYVQGLFEASDGTIWFATLSPSGDGPGYLCCFRGQRFSALPIPHGKIYALIEDSLGKIWLGGVSDRGEGWGLSCYDGEELVTYTTAEGLPDDRVHSIIEDDAGNLWLGAGQGLCYFDLSAVPAQAGGRRFRAYGTEQGLPNVQHGYSAKDTMGHLWFGSIGGLYRIDGEHFQTLTTDDGLPSNRVTGLVPQPDGSMIIGTGRGIVHYRPTATVPPPIEIREVVADAVYQNPTEIQIIAVGENTHVERSEIPHGGASPLLTISYHSLSLATKRMRYSYILEGYDKDWQDTWERSVRYENLPEGQYTFKVIAINRDLVKSETPAQLSLTIVPDPRDLEIATLRTEVTHLRREVSGKYDFSNLIGRSAAIKEVHLLMERAIDSGLNVLITGETGTGKELVANGIHYNSTRGTQTPVTCDCGTLSKDLAASELFGHPKGAFTDAHEDKIGLFEAADGNTLILDEIGNMPLEVQRNLLRALDEGKIRRVGETTPRNVDVRVIAVTNLDLEKEKEAGRFREDLYYRLNEFPIPLPPLRERREDIPLLAKHFLGEIDKDIDGFAPGVFEMLQSYNWPGNVRELQKAIRLAAAFAEEGERLETYHFALQISQGESLIQEVMSEPGSYRELVDRFQRRVIEETLRECGGNRSAGARKLGIDRANLIRLIKRLGIETK